VKAYFDTNVLIAASVGQHPHHEPAFQLVAAVKRKAMQGCLSAHGMLEFYSVLTRAPFQPRVHPADAARLLDENILPYFDVVELSSRDYKALVQSCAATSRAGGFAYEALHLRCAQKANCDRIYTFNVKDFRALAPKGLEDKIATP
jgi:predicted nucleic acid-binding protein